jgi:hypothetical protein
MNGSHGFMAVENQVFYAGTLSGLMIPEDSLSRYSLVVVMKKPLG